MNAADAPAPLDSKTLWLRRWWGRAVYALGTASAATFAVILISTMVDGGQAIAGLIREWVARPLFWLEVLSAIMLTPFIETGLMAWIIRQLMRSVSSRYAVMILSAAIWAVIHRLVTNPSGWLAFFPFLAFSYAYIERRQEPHRDGFIVATMSHAFYNLASVMLLISSGFVR